uniref:Uncharacterized protein n=1 Tax=Salmonella phage vB_SEnST11_KE23 TaxID=3161174 RepID=A0AAU8GEX7_9CAUD
MFEMLTVPQSAEFNPLLFEFDAEKQVVGDTEMINQVTGLPCTSIDLTVAGQSGYTNEVINHATYGQVFSLSGNRLFVANDILLPPSLATNKAIIYEITFQSTGSGQMFCTGGSVQGAWRVGFVVTRGLSNFTVQLVESSSGGSATTSTIATSANMQKLIASTSGSNIFKALVEDGTGVCGPYTLTWSRFTRLCMFCTMAAAEGNQTTRQMYGHLKSVRVYIGDPLP